MEGQFVKQHTSIDRAIDIALWMNFKYRLEKRVFGVTYYKKTKLYQIIENQGRKNAKSLPIPKDYSQMSYEQIQMIRADSDPFNHWEEIMGLFSVTHGELLRFILMYNIPLDKIIRYEIAARGHDQNNQWVGFDKAQEIWFK